MKKNTSIALATLALTALLPLAAFAENGATPTLTSAEGSPKEMRLNAAETKVKDRAGKEIDRRIEALTNLSTRIGEMKRVSDDEKSSLTEGLKGQLDALHSLRDKVDSDSSTTTLAEDVKSIGDDYRVFKLQLPKFHLQAAADRVLHVVDMLSGVVAKLQTRIATASGAGKDVTGANASLADMNAQIADAKSQAQAAVAEIANLAPDNGDKTIADANTAALKDAALKIKAAQKDLMAARKDATDIVKATKLPETSGEGSATTTHE